MKQTFSVLSRLAVIVGGVVLLFNSARADIPKRINFQGVLKDTLGNPVPDGNYSLTFRIYDASSGGNTLWQEGQLVSVRGGIFTHLLGSAIPVPESVFSDSLRWVGVQVGSNPEISPRRQLVSVPYAYVADFAQNAGKLGGTDESNFVRRIGPDSVKTSTGNALKVQSSGSSPNDMSGIIGRADNAGTNDAYGGSFVGMATGTGRGYGITGYGETNSSLAAYGANAVGTSTSTGPAYGGLFQATDLGTGEHYGVKAEGFAASNSTTYGLYGNASNTSTGDAVGGYFTTASAGTGDHLAVWAEGFGASPSTVYGVNGVANNTSSGSAIGGYFTASSSGSGNHTGVFGTALGATGATTYGVHGLANNTSTGTVYGGFFTTSNSGTGSSYAVYGNGLAASSSPAHGVFGFGDNTSTGLAYGGRFFTSSSGTGTHYGVDGAGFSSSSSPAVGCAGFADNNSTGFAYGGLFNVSNTGTGTHYAVSAAAYGSSSNATYGCSGFADNSSTGLAYGGIFTATASGTGAHFGVYGVEIVGGSGAAVYAAGDFAGSGAKYAVCKTSQGNRLMSVIEAPEVWFEDFGEGQLVNGQAHIELDPLFLETVTINASNPIKVFVQLKDDCKGVYVKTQNVSFDVFELQSGTNNAAFSYRLVAKRKGYETQRLKATDIGMEDPNLYPELWEKIEKENQQRQAEVSQATLESKQ